LLEVADFRQRLFQALFELRVARKKPSMLSLEFNFAFGAPYQEPVMLSFPVAGLPLQLNGCLLGELNHFACERRTFRTGYSGQVG
jgi:hypothetical protein